MIHNLTTILGKKDIDVIIVVETIPKTSQRGWIVSEANVVVLGVVYFCRISVVRITDDEEGREEGSRLYLMGLLFPLFRSSEFTSFGCGVEGDGVSLKVPFEPSQGRYWEILLSSLSSLLLIGRILITRHEDLSIVTPVNIYTRVVLGLCLFNKNFVTWNKI